MGSILTPSRLTLWMLNISDLRFKKWKKMKDYMFTILIFSIIDLKYFDRWSENSIMFCVILKMICALNIENSKAESSLILLCWYLRNNCFI